MTRRGRPRGRKNPIASANSALEYLLTKYQREEVTRRACLGAAGVIAKDFFTLGDDLTRWFLEARRTLRRVPAPPTFLVELLSKYESTPAVPPSEPDFVGLPGAEGIGSLPAMVRGIADARASLQSTKSLADALDGAQRLGLVRWTDQSAFSALPVAETTATSTPITASELMALSVVVGLEPPDDDNDLRLNTWEHRLRVVRKRLRPSISAIAKALGKVIGARTQYVGDVVGLLPRFRAPFAKILRAAVHSPSAF